MLSILIPVYEYEVSLMVKEVHRQASSLGIDFEIICLNDASFSKNPTSELSNFKWIENKTNLGRAKSRNKLVSAAMHRKFNATSSKILISATKPPRTWDWLTRV